MAGRNHRPAPVRSTAKKAPAKVETKLKNWGSCAGQGEMFGDQELWDYKYGKGAKQ